MNDRYLSRLEFDLAYLALLTRYNVKRLSRWEGRLSPDQIAALRGLDLEVRQVRRRLLFGRKTQETVFSRKPQWTELYRSRFDMTRIRETPEEVRLKGFLFGYPSCCVEAFIRKPYSENDLSPRDREILFHWACKGCRITPQLLKEYHQIHQECVGIFGGVEPVRPTPLFKAKRRDHINIARALRHGALPATVGLSALLLLPYAGPSHGSGSQSRANADADPHLLPVADDTDEDYLSYAEERLLGMDPHNHDIDGDGDLDGIHQADLIKGLIDSLPWYEYGDPNIPSDRPYVIENAMCGVIECAVCGEFINMGYITIINPQRGLQVDVPYMSLHYLEHGSLTSSSIWWPEDPPQEYRFDLPGFRRVMLVADESHLKFDEPYADPDADGLNSDEETFLGTNPGVSDTDSDSVKDGPQFIEGLLEALGELPRVESGSEPYLIENNFRGVETCDVCGATFNMGYAHIVNPVEGLSLDVPFVALHYLAHGSSTYEGSVNQGRVLPILLKTVLTGDGSSHWLEIEDDGDADGLRDEEEAYFSLSPVLKDTDGDGVPDGPELATLMHNIIDQLPEGPLPDTTYIVHNLTFGFYQCLICGEYINMGYIDIVNPQTATSILVPYYNLHFMGCGSFSTDRPELYARIDPRDIDEVIDISSHASTPQTEPGANVLSVYPNPFRTSTRIACNLNERQGITLAIYDAAGRQVRDFGSAFGKGKELVWEGRDSRGTKLAPGTYFCEITLGDFTFTRKVVLLE